MEKRTQVEELATKEDLKRAEFMITENRDNITYIKGNVIDGALKDIRCDLQELKNTDEKIVTKLGDLTVAVTSIKNLETRMCTVEEVIPTLLTKKEYQIDKDNAFKGKKYNWSVVSILLGTAVGIAGLIIGAVL